jgi:hypothetical protein
LAFLSDIPTGKFSRDDVRAQFVDPIGERAIIWTIIWGYERARIGNNPDNIIHALVNAGRMAETLNRIISVSSRRGPLPAECIIKLLNNAGKVGTSTSSKVAAMARLQSREGECVILDQQVIGSIFCHRFIEFRALEQLMMPRTIDGRNCFGERIEKAFNRRTKFYGDYVRQVRDIASDLGTHAEQLERFLFRTAPEMAPINERWRRIKDKRSKIAAGLGLSVT